MGRKNVPLPVAGFLAVALALGWLAARSFAAGAPAPAPVKVKLATLVPKGTSYHQALLAMGEKWRQAPDGGVALTIYTDGTMGSEADIVRRMRVGQLQAAVLTVSGIAEIDPSVGALQTMPLVYRSTDELEYVLAKLRPALEQKLAEKGFVILFWSDAGWVRFFCRHAASRPADLTRMKIFVGAGNTDQIDITKAAGYQAVPLEWSDALTSLRTGMIDVVPVPPFYALAGQFYTVAGHMIELDWAPLAGATVITKKTWDGLTPAARQALLAAAEETAEHIKARGRQENAEAIEAMKKRGLQVHAVSPQAREEWEKLARRVYPRIRGAVVPAETFDEVMRLLAEYRARPGGGK